ncbi:MAG: PHP domain-containing protein [Deltaproteobacteria bacterium]|nr:PHP domain-containing protein [Deltaproteobacteria bacterium]
MLIDLHIHSNRRKDSTLDPRDIIARAKNTILDGIVFTDGGYYEDANELKDYGLELGLIVLFGAEIHTDKGHMLIYLPEPERLNDFSQDEYRISEIINRVNSLKGAIVAAHPYRKDIDKPLGDGLFNITGLTAIETESGFSDNTANMLAYDAASRLGIPMTGGSATRTDFENLGAYATLFSGKINNEKELVDKLLGSRYYPVTIK